MTTKRPTGAGDAGDDNSQPGPLYGFLDKLKAAPEQTPEQTVPPEWAQRREEFKTDRKKLKAFLDRAAEAVLGPYRERKKDIAGQRIAEFSFHFGKTDATPLPAALRAALELAEVWDAQHPIAFAIWYSKIYPHGASDLWSAVRGRGVRGQYPALSWRVVRPFAGLRWIPEERFVGDTVLHPPSAETINALPELMKYWETIRDGVQAALEGLTAIRNLQSDRIARHREAELELDRIVQQAEEATAAGQEPAGDIRSRIRAAERRLLQVDAGPGSERDMWFNGDVILNGPLLWDVGLLAPLLPRLASQCADVRNLFDGSQPAEIVRSVKNLQVFSRVAGEVVAAVAREFPDGRRGRGRPGKTGIGRAEVLERSRQILSSIYPQLCTDLSDSDLKSRGQRAWKSAVNKG
jgi:hypothetical protein